MSRSPEQEHAHIFTDATFLNNDSEHFSSLACLSTPSLLHNVSAGTGLPNVRRTGDSLSQGSSDSLHASKEYPKLTTGVARPPADRDSLSLASSTATPPTLKHDSLSCFPIRLPSLSLNLPQQPEPHEAGTFHFFGFQFDTLWPGPWVIEYRRRQAIDEYNTRWLDFTYGTSPALHVMTSALNNLYHTSSISVVADACSMWSTQLKLICDTPSLLSQPFVNTIVCNLTAAYALFAARENADGFVEVLFTSVERRIVESLLHIHCETDLEVSCDVMSYCLPIWKTYEVDRKGVHVREACT
ncbi:unnamed protein product [Cutaneotrichosporon oleaginosum]